MDKFNRKKKLFTVLATVVFCMIPVVPVWAQQIDIDTFKERMNIYISHESLGYVSVDTIVSAFHQGIEDAFLRDRGMVRIGRNSYEPLTQSTVNLEYRTFKKARLYYELMVNELMEMTSEVYESDCATSVMSKLDNGDVIVISLESGENARVISVKQDKLSTFEERGWSEHYTKKIPTGGYQLPDSLTQFGIKRVEMDSLEALSGGDEVQNVNLKKFIEDISGEDYPVPADEEDYYEVVSCYPVEGDWSYRNIDIIRGNYLRGLVVSRFFLDNNELRRNYDDLIKQADALVESGDLEEVSADDYGKHYSFVTEVSGYKNYLMIEKGSDIVNIIIKNDKVYSHDLHNSFYTSDLGFMAGEDIQLTAEHFLPNEAGNNSRNNIIFGEKSQEIDLDGDDHVEVAYILCEDDRFYFRVFNLDPAYEDMNLLMEVHCEKDSRCEYCKGKGIIRIADPGEEETKPEDYDYYMLSNNSLVKTAYSKALGDMKYSAIDSFKYGSATIFNFDSDTYEKEW